MIWWWLLLHFCGFTMRCYSILSTHRDATGADWRRQQCLEAHPCGTGSCPLCSWQPQDQGVHFSLSPTTFSSRRKEWVKWQMQFPMGRKGWNHAKNGFYSQSNNILKREWIPHSIVHTHAKKKMFSNEVSIQTSLYVSVINRFRSCIFWREDPSSWQNNPFQYYGSM